MNDIELKRTFTQIAILMERMTTLLELHEDRLDRDSERITRVELR